MGLSARACTVESVVRPHPPLIPDRRLKGMLHFSILHKTRFPKPSSPQALFLHSHCLLHYSLHEICGAASKTSSVATLNQLFLVNVPRWERWTHGWPEVEGGVGCWGQLAARLCLGHLERQPCGVPSQGFLPVRDGPSGQSGQQLLGNLRFGILISMAVSIDPECSQDVFPFKATSYSSLAALIH